MLSLYRDSDCGRCEGGDHCAKCLELTPVAQSFTPAAEKGWLRFDYVPFGSGANDVLYNIRRNLSESELLDGLADRALAHVVASLCLHRKVSYTRRMRGTSPDGIVIGKNSINAAVDALEAIGLLLKTNGTNTGVSHTAGTIEGTDEFYRLMGAFRPQWILVPRPAILRKKKEDTSAELALPQLSRIESRLHKWLHEINLFSRDYPMLLMKFPSSRTIFRPNLRMIFNETLRFGGRVYADGGDYQNIPRADRKRLWLSGQWVVEPDFSAHHVRLVYAMANLRYSEIHADGDPYYLEIDRNQVDRSICKGIVLVAINCDSKNQALSAYRSKAAGGEFPESSNIGQIYDAFLNKHQPIQKWFANGKDKGLRLHKIEGEIMVRAMHTLMKQRLPSFPMHDSLLVPESAEGAAIIAMEQAYTDTLRRKGVSNFDPPVISKGGSPRSQNPDRFLGIRTPFSGRNNTLSGSLLNHRKPHTESIKEQIPRHIKSNIGEVDTSTLTPRSFFFSSSDQIRRITDGSISER